MKKMPQMTLTLVTIVTLSILPALSMAQAQANTPTDTAAEAKTYAAAKVSNPLGKALPCDTLKQSIEDKLQSKNVKNFKLDVVDFSDDAAGKVVGRCDGGKHKIIYTKN